jgi:hypothetical protein
MTWRVRVQRLRHEAERCFRLANGIADAQTSEELEAIGREYQRAAEALEQRERSLAA